MKKISQRSIRRAGMTIIELMVALTIVGILLAILMPAVQSSRAVARRTQCANNLRQIGIGLAQFSENSGYIPTDDFAIRKLLPYLDQKALADRLQNGTAPQTFYVPWVSCPADGLVATEVSESSYRFNAGTRFLEPNWRGSFRYPEVPNGISTSQEEVGRSLNEISDGLSQTAMLAERLVLKNGADPEESVLKSETSRYLWYTEKRFTGLGEESLAVDQCQSHRTGVLPYIPIASGAGLMTLHYDHMLPPNHPGCMNGPTDFEWSPWMRLIPPSSLHRGGVNVLFADGSTHFVNDSIDLKTWNAIGTRNGHETVSLD